MMEHFSESIGHEWFDFQNLYRYAVEQAPNERPVTFVELGVHKGASSAFMAVEIINSSKPINLFAVDQWKDDVTGEEDVAREELARQNLLPVSNYIEIIKSESSEAASQFDDHSVDFLFIDAGHEYEDVRKDIDAWLPKMKLNSIVAGHDYFEKFPGVIKAVHETWPNEIRIVNWISWLVRLENGKAVSNYE